MLIFKEEALQEIRQAQLWYEGQKLGRGGECEGGVMRSEALAGSLVWGGMTVRPGAARAGLGIGEIQVDPRPGGQRVWGVIPPRRQRRRVLEAAGQRGRQGDDHGGALDYLARRRLDPDAVVAVLDPTNGRVEPHPVTQLFGHRLGLSLIHI